MKCEHKNEEIKEYRKVKAMLVECRDCGHMRIVNICEDCGQGKAIYIHQSSQNTAPTNPQRSGSRFARRATLPSKANNEFSNRPSRAL